MSPTIAMVALMKAMGGGGGDDDDEEPEVSDYQRALGQQLHRQQNRG